MSDHINTTNDDYDVNCSELASKVVCEIDRRFIVQGPRFQPFNVDPKCLQMMRGLSSAVRVGPGGQFLANYDGM